MNKPIQFTIKQIEPYVAKKLITKRHHPDYPELVIFNYTDKCAIEGAWDYITMTCRGLIMNEETGEVIARPFPKFFNHNQREAPEVNQNEDKVIMEKYDGSLGILFFYDGLAHIATRGSFESEQAIWATEWIRYNHPEVISELSKDITFLFEIIYPENRIVLNYDFSGLVCIGAIQIATGKNMDVIYRKGLLKMKVVETFEKMQDSRENKEGYVVFYKQSNQWLKYKHDEYVKLHKVVTGLSEKGIWETLRDKKSLDSLLDGMPDEFHDWATGVSNKIMTDYVNLYMDVRHVVDKIKDMDRKEQADYLRENYPHLLTLAFSRIDGRMDNLEEGIFKMIKPSQK